MSLGKYKTKREIYSDTFDVEWEKVADSWYYDDYYDYWWNYDYDEYCTKSCCMAEYSIKKRVYSTYVHRSYGRVSIDEQLVGELIDMDTIYQIGTIYYRERMLRRLLGEEKAHADMKNTLGDYFNKNEDNR